jgi:hypothetical protein
MPRSSLVPGRTTKLPVESSFEWIVSFDRSSVSPKQHFDLNESQRVDFFLGAKYCLQCEKLGCLKDALLSLAKYANHVVRISSEKKTLGASAIIGS